MKSKMVFWVFSLCKNITVVRIDYKDVKHFQVIIATERPFLSASVGFLLYKDLCVVKDVLQTRPSRTIPDISHRFPKDALPEINSFHPKTRVDAYD